MDFENVNTEELEGEEARLSMEIQALDGEITDLREEMRATSRAVEPVRVELQRRRRNAADSDPRTQTIGGE